MQEPQPLTLHNPDALHEAIATMALTQASPLTSRPFIGAALTAINNGDVGTALTYITAAQHYTLTGKQPAIAAAALIRQAFQLDQEPA